MSQARRRDPRGLLKERARAVARPLLVYWVFLVLMFGAFTLAIFIDEGFDPEGVLALMAFAAITAGGVLTGQVAALLRVRDWLLFVNWGLFWTVGMALGVFASSATGALGIFVVIFVVMYPLFTIGGAWSLRAGKALFGAWVPLMYATGCAIIIAEDRGRVATWHEGAKWAVWDLFTLSVLGMAIVLFLVYLISRETHRLALWRRGPVAPLMGSVKESGAARPRLSIVGWFLVGGLAFTLTLGTAIMAPYLWRTGPGEADEDDDPGAPSEQPQDEPDQAKEPGDKGKGEPRDRANKELRQRWEEAAGERMEELREGARPTVSQTIDLLTTLLIALTLLILLLLAFYRPSRRMILARHYERPLTRASPTDRIRNGWRLVEIALGDAGVEPRPNEPAGSLVRRARPVLEQISPGGVEVHGLAEAAEIRDRVEYGLGVHPEDVKLMERTARWTYHTVWDRLGEWVKVKKLYRGI